MRKLYILALASCILGAAPTTGFSAPASESLFQVAANSCRAMHATCAKRCKQRAPTDANCVSDHCDPKLSECRQTGCWQEGRLYGGAETCNLAK